MTANDARTLFVFATMFASLASRPVLAQTLTVSGNPAKLTITTAVAGSQPNPVSDATTTYTVITLTPNRTYRITAQLNANMPTGTTLTGTFAAPPGGTSVGAVGLDVTARNVVTGIPRNTVSTRGITYQFSATAAAGVIASTTRTVTLTIISP